MRPLKNCGSGSGLIVGSHIGRVGINFDTKKQNLGSKNPSFPWERVVARVAEWGQETAEEEGVWASDPDLLCHFGKGWAICINYPVFGGTTEMKGRGGGGAVCLPLSLTLFIWILEKWFLQEAYLFLFRLHLTPDVSIPLASDLWTP